MDTYQAIDISLLLVSLLTYVLNKLIKNNIETIIEAVSNDYIILQYYHLYLMD